MVAECIAHRARAKDADDRCYKWKFLIWCLLLLCLRHISCLLQLAAVLCCENTCQLVMKYAALSTSAANIRTCKYLVSTAGVCPDTGWSRGEMRGLDTSFRQHTAGFKSNPSFSRWTLITRGLQHQQFCIEIKYRIYQLLNAVPYWFGNHLVKWHLNE